MGKVSGNLFGPPVAKSTQGRGTGRRAKSAADDTSEQRAASGASGSSAREVAKMSSGCLLMAQGVLRRTGACSARVLAQASRSLQATSMGLQAGNLEQGPAAFHSGNTGGFAGDAVPFVVGPRGARSAGPSAASRGLCTSSTSAETKEVDQEAATTMIDGEEPNIKYDKVQNEVSFARASRNRAGTPRVRERERLRPPHGGRPDRAKKRGTLGWPRSPAASGPLSLVLFLAEGLVSRGADLPHSRPVCLPRPPRRT